MGSPIPAAFSNWDEELRIFGNETANAESYGEFRLLVF
jgi:hypothetical protein